MRSATDVVAPRQATRDYKTVDAVRAITLDDDTDTNLLEGTATEVACVCLANSSPACAGYHVSFTKPMVLEPRHGSLVPQPTSIVAGHPDRSPVTIIGEHPSPSTVGGNTRVAAFSVLNYLSDLGADKSGCSDYPNHTDAFATAKECKVHGVSSCETFANQGAKIVNVINTLGADVVALEEVENPVAVGAGTNWDATPARFVEIPNKATGDGTWVYVPSPSSVLQGEDVIRIMFIYRPVTIVPVGPSLIHNDPTFMGLARQPLTQEFARATGQRATPATFIVTDNHFESKGFVPEGAPPGNVDNGGEQGNASAIRVVQAASLVSFIARLADKPTLLVGDFDSYSQEGPIKVLGVSGWAHVSGTDEASYVYAGRSGSLDHVFSNVAAKPPLSGVISWAVNAQESTAFEYSRVGVDARSTIEVNNPYRSSDHNPEIIDLTFLRASDATPLPTALEIPAPSETPSPTPRPGTIQMGPVFSHGAPPCMTRPQRGLPHTDSDTDRATGLGIIPIAMGGGLILPSRCTRRRD